LVEETAKKYNVPFYTINFETKKYADEKKISIQMSARELRYAWFEKIRKEHNFDFIATAHHKDDVIETFLINLARGTGIKGLTGIKPKNGNIIRPMLFANRAEIAEFCNEKNIAFREDASNQETYYARNFIRKNIITEFEKIYPTFRNNLIHTSEHLKDAENVLKSEVEKVKKEIVTISASLRVKRSNLITDEETERLLHCVRNDGELKINIEKLQKLENNVFFLSEIIQDFGFNYSDAKDMIKSLETNAGKIFYSQSHQALRDREFIVISVKIEVEKVEILIEKNSKNEFSFTQSSSLRERHERGNLNTDEETERLLRCTRNDGFDFLDLPNQKLNFQILDAKNYKITPSKSISILDFDKLKFPLTLRNWKNGDYFYPLGMTQKKKIADFLTNQKLSITEKQQTYVLCSENEIVAILNHRIDNRFKITGNTVNVLVVEVLE
jgi:tRNA(Ile)-lysidine synthase